MKKQSAIRRLKMPSRATQVRIGVVVAVAALSLYGGVALKSNWGNISTGFQEFIARQIDARVKQVLVSGVIHTDAQALRDAIGVDKGDSLVGFDAASARMAIEELPWVRMASVVRELPSTVRVDIYEHKPLARLKQDEDTLWVINRDGYQISEANESFDHLPILSGEGADAQASSLFSLLATEPELMQKLVGARYVGERRWDVFFQDEVQVMLPEEQPLKALKILAKLEAERQVMKMSGVTVDLRLEDRIILRLPEAARRDTYL